MGAVKNIKKLEKKISYVTRGPMSPPNRGARGGGPSTGSESKLTERRLLE